MLVTELNLAVHGGIGRGLAAAQPEIYWELIALLFRIVPAHFNCWCLFGVDPLDT
jgi:hypothetical protein